MLDVLAHRTYRLLFSAQVVSLLGTGLATVALALLAYDLAGERAGAVLGTALAIKMVAYVSIAPLASAFVSRMPRRAMLVALDLVRGGIALILPFVTQTWQVYALILLLQSASAAFTPAFQATIPDLLQDEDDYTKALSLSRLAYDLENLVSPALAAALLSLMSFHWLFAGTAFGFVGSAALVLSVTLPSPRAQAQTRFTERLTRGVRIFSVTPRLRGLMAINLTVAAGGALVIVNTVVYVKSALGLGEQQTAIALAAFGGGSMLVAVLLPRVLRHVDDRSVMLVGGCVLAIMTALGARVSAYWQLLGLWLALGAGYTMAQLPSGRLLRRSALPEDRPALFAAQFALSHACWLVTYPIAGWFGESAGLAATALLLSGVAAIAALLAFWIWPVNDDDAIVHAHPDLPADHPHLATGTRVGAHRHSHPPIADEHHPA